MSITVPAAPYPYALDPDATALIVIDMQRDFVEPGGFGGSLGNDVSLLHTAGPPIARRLAAWRAREAGGMKPVPALHEAMDEVIAAQVEKLAFSNTFVDVTNDPSARLAAKLAALAPGDLNRVHFTTGGSTAVDTAVRMVWFYQSCMGRPDKTDIVARDHSYHGSTYLSQSVGKRPGDRVEEFRYKETGIHHLTPPNTYRRPEGMSEAQFCDALVAEFEALIDRVGADRIGGFIAEPIQASGGVIMPPDGYLRRMWEVCQRHDILFIADEVVTALTATCMPSTPG